MEHRLAAPHVGEREREPVDLDPVAARDQPLDLLRVALRIRAPGQPPAVLAALGGPKGGIGEDVLVADLLAPAERLEDRPSGKLVDAVPEHRPVRDLTGRRSPGADPVEDAARAGGAQAVEIRRVGRLVPCPPAESGVRAVAEAVQQDDHDRVHVAGETRPVRDRAT